jgi:hypothetical protein
MKTSEAIALLNQCHSFPGPFVFKLIGENTTRFYDTVLAEVSAELGEIARQEAGLLTRRSSGGKYLSITLNVEMASAEQVLRLYERFSSVEGLKVMM